MVGEITKDTRSPLLPDRLDQPDLFVCDIFDAAPKGDMASMAHPIFSLSTKPDHRIRRYEDESGKNFVEVKPSAEGLATIHDRDVLIYCISQLIAGLNDGKAPSKTLRMKAYDFLKATNRVTDGRGYEGLRSALLRLQGTQIETNIVTGDTEQLDIFSIIDRARIVRQTRDGRMQEIEISSRIGSLTRSAQRKCSPSTGTISGSASPLSAVSMSSRASIAGRRKNGGSPCPSCSANADHHPRSGSLDG